MRNQPSERVRKPSNRFGNQKTLYQSFSRKWSTWWKAAFFMIIFIAGCTEVKDIQEVRPGIYATNEIQLLPLPLSGYTVYVVGEDHGTREIHFLTLEYLKMLNKANGLRDIILEEPYGYEEMFSDYVQGTNEHILEISGMDSYAPALLDGIRAFNETLPEDEKIRVHLVDVDSPLSAVHLHLQRLQHEIDVDAAVPPFEEFEKLSKADALHLVEKLEEKTEDPSLKEELETVESSLNFYFTGSEIGIGATSTTLTPEGCHIREERITQNITILLQKLDGAPVLVKCGSWHAQKHQSMSSYTQVRPWAHQLTERGINIFALYAVGMSGYMWHSSLGEISYHKDLYRIQFDDGTKLGTIIERGSDYSIFYVDLQLDANKSARLGYNFADTPAGAVYDGIIVFREVTPLVQEGH